MNDLYFIHVTTALVRFICECIISVNVFLSVSLNIFRLMFGVNWIWFSLDTQFYTYTVLSCADFLRWRFLYNNVVNAVQLFTEVSIAKKAVRSKWMGLTDATQSANRLWWHDLFGAFSYPKDGERRVEVRRLWVIFQVKNSLSAIADCSFRNR